MNKAVQIGNGLDSHSIKRNVQFGVLAIVSLGVGGCSFMGNLLPGSDDTVDYAQVSANLIDAISQYPQIDSASETYAASAADSAFEQQIYDAMEASGFILASNGEQLNADSVNAEINNSQGTMSDAKLFGLSVGEVSVEREFAVRNGKTVPVSEMVFRSSSDAEHSIVLNDAELFESVDADYSTVLFEPESDPAGNTLFGARMAAMRSSSVEPEPESVEPAESAEPLVGSAVVKRNLYDNELQSNYSALLEDYQEIDKSVLIFPNDSLRLGENNKQVILDFAERLNTGTDVLSIVGCSHGTTDISNGNAVLALGRANRVKEALLFSGVEQELLLDEGCWAPYEVDEALPARGVVLTLKRRAAP